MKFLTCHGKNGWIQYQCSVIVLTITNIIKILILFCFNYYYLREGNINWNTCWFISICISKNILFLGWKSVKYLFSLGLILYPKIVIQLLSQIAKYYMVYGLLCSSLEFKRQCMEFHIICMTCVQNELAVKK